MVYFFRLLMVMMESILFIYELLKSTVTCLLILSQVLS